MQPVRELAGMLAQYGLNLHSLHAPLERDTAAGRGSGVPISIADPELRGAASSVGPIGG